MPVGATGGGPTQLRAVQSVVDRLQGPEDCSERAIHDSRTLPIEEGRELSERLAESNPGKWRNNQIVDAHHLANLAEVLPQKCAGDGKTERFADTQVVAARRRVVNVSAKAMAAKVRS